MILNNVSYIDCIIFLFFLAPQLLIQIGPLGTFICISQALPFLLLKLPAQFIHERILTEKTHRSPFVQKATIFQDIVIRCVRYAFADIPASIGRVFFSKWVALPFLRFRMLRHGYWKSPIAWREIRGNGFEGVWITTNAQADPDVIIYYCHGGGFSMGSSYFYLEFLLAWTTLLKEQGFKNPAIFALEYTLVPDATYPTQLNQTAAGYEYLLSIAGPTTSICVGGDSAGATLILSLLLRLGSKSSPKIRMPDYATLISPWTTLVSAKNQNTRSDYLNAESLHQYGSQYAGTKSNLQNPLVSPGMCKDVNQWSRAMPSRGMLIIFGSEEVFVREIVDLIRILKSCKTNGRVETITEPGEVHAWPVVRLFLGEGSTERKKGLGQITKHIWNECGAQ